MTSPSPPPAPSAATTVQQSQLANAETAQAQQGLNAINQYAPQGSSTYEQIGNWDDGTRRLSQTTSLSPEQQQLYDQQTSNQILLGQVGGGQLNKVGDILGTPFDLNSATNDQQAEIARKLLDPTWKAREGQIDAKLANQGIPIGSEARTLAMRDFGMQRDNDYLAALLGTRSQAVTEALANRNQPLNEISALLSGSQVSMPQFGQTPQTSIAPTNVGGIYSDSYQNQLAGYNAGQAQTNAMIGGLFGLGGAAVSPFAYAGGKKFFS